jgi:hypothetical protein
LPQATFGSELNNRLPSVESATTFLARHLHNEQIGKTMIATTPLPTIETVRLDTMLADAVVLNWNDLMPEPASGLVHIEYHVDPLGSVEYMKVWASTVRGYWKLACEHWMRWDTNHQSGLRFDNGYQSDQLAKMLETIMRHQEIFLVHAAPGKDRMIQVHPPTDAEKSVANSMMEVFRERMAA